MDNQEQMRNDEKSRADHLAEIDRLRENLRKQTELKAQNNVPPQNSVKSEVHATASTGPASLDDKKQDAEKKTDDLKADSRKSEDSKKDNARELDHQEQVASLKERVQTARSHPDYLDAGQDRHPGMTSQGIETRAHEAQVANTSTPVQAPQAQSTAPAKEQTAGAKLAAKHEAIHAERAKSVQAKGLDQPPERTYAAAERREKQVAKMEQNREQKEASKTTEKDLAKTM